MTSSITFVRRLHQLIRHWRFRHDLDIAINFDLIDFISYAQEFRTQTGLKPLLVTDEGVFVQTNLGFFVWFNPRYKHGILWGVEKNGVWEVGVTKHCIERMKKGGTFLDIGANVGMFSMSIAISMENIAVHAFEPVPDNYLTLEKNVKINKLSSKVILNNLAVGCECKTISMMVDGQLSHVSTGNNKSEFKSVGINCVSIDHYCETNRINDVTLIKCDVEGFELEVLKGAEKTIRLHKPTLILEIEDRWTHRYGYSGKDIFVLMESMNYVSQSILPNGELGHMDSSIEQKLNQSNVFLLEPKV
jgi:FkbM family methyltransferase